MSTASRITKEPPRAEFAVLRFGAVSLLSAVVDNIIFYLVFRATGRIFESQIAARCVSVLFNYALVRTSVFRSVEAHGILLPRYLMLVALNALLSYTGIRVLTGISSIGVIPAKMLAETLLFLLNFVMQRAWVFRRSAGRPQP
jgi:putative flippase GtrA